MKIVFKDNDHYNLITECDHKDLPIIPNVGDVIWLEDERYHVVRREFELKESQQDSSFCDDLCSILKDIYDTNKKRQAEGFT